MSDTNNPERGVDKRYGYLVAGIKLGESFAASMVLGGLGVFGAPTNEIAWGMFGTGLVIDGLKYVVPRILRKDKEQWAADLRVKTQEQIDSNIAAVNEIKERESSGRLASSASIDYDSKLKEIGADNPMARRIKEAENRKTDGGGNTGGWQ